MEPTLSTPPQTLELIPTFTPDGRVLFGCVSCRKKLSVKPTTIGKTITCPHCKSSNLVPDPSALASKPVAVEPVATPGTAEPAYENVLLDPAAVLASKGIEPLAATSVSVPLGAAPEPGSYSPVVPEPAAVVPEGARRVTPSFSADGRVVFGCSGCQKKLSVKSTTIGKTINCAHCQTPNKVPDPLAKSAEAVVVSQAAEPVAPISVNVIQPESAAVVSLSSSSPAPHGHEVGHSVEAGSVGTPAEGARPAGTSGALGKVKIDGPDRFVFTCYFCSRKMSVKLTSVGRSVKCQVCHNENIVPSPQQAKGADVVMPTKEQWAVASQNVATGDHVEVRVFFPCFACHKKLSAKIDQAGQAIRCPGCSVVNAVPGLSTGLISPADESGSMQVSNQLVYDAPHKMAVVATAAAPVALPAPVPVSVLEEREAEKVVVAQVPAPEAPAQVVLPTVSPAEPLDEPVQTVEAVVPVDVVTATPEPETAAIEMGSAVVEESPGVVAAAESVVTEPIAAEPVAIEPVAIEPVAAEQVVIKSDPEAEPAPIQIPVVATTPEAVVSVSATTPPLASPVVETPANQEAEKDYMVPTARLDPQKPLGPTDLGEPIPVGESLIGDEGEEVQEAFSLVVPESDEEPIFESAQEPKDEIQDIVQAKDEPAAVKAAIVPPAAADMAKASADDSSGEFTLAPPGSVPAKAPAAPSIASLELSSLNKSQALAALAQMIPSASSKAAEITEDSAVLPPVNRPGMRSELALRRSGKGGGESGGNDQNFSLPELKPHAGGPKVERAEQAEDAFEPISPLTSTPVAPPKPVGVESRSVAPVEQPVAVTPPAVSMAAPASTPAAKPAVKPPEKPGQGGVVVPTGFIAFRCQGCSKRLTVKSKHAGQEMPCPVCKQMNKVPPQTPEGVLDTPGVVKPVPKGPASPAAVPAKPVKPTTRMMMEGGGGSLMGEVLDLGLEEKKAPAKSAAQTVPAKKPVVPVQPVKPPAPAPTKPVAPAAKAPAKPAVNPSSSKAPAPKHDPNDPFAGLAQASEGQSLDLSDALNALAGGASQGGANELDDLASALGGVSMGDADPDDITTALSMQMDQPDDGLLINPAPPVDEDGPIGLADDPTPGPGGKPKAPAASSYKGPPPTAAATGSIPNAGKFIPTNKNDGKLRFPCSQCGHRLKVPPEAKGKKAKCPACGTVNNVPL